MAEVPRIRINLPVVIEGETGEVDGEDYDDKRHKDAPNRDVERYGVDLRAEQH